MDSKVATKWCLEDPLHDFYIYRSEPMNKSELFNMSTVLYADVIFNLRTMNSCLCQIAEGIST